MTVSAGAAARRRRPRLGSARQTDLVRHPSSLEEAQATLDRLARYCEFSCALDTGACLEDGCEAWNLERAAADWLESRWLDGQD